MINNSFTRKLFAKMVNEIGLEQTIINTVIIMGVLLIYTYVIYDFMMAKKRKSKKKKEVKSIVETASMSAFFMLVAFVVNFKIGTFKFHNMFFTIFFLTLYIIGAITNILGRYFLGNNWGNNVVIYTDHTLVTNGVYKIVRHPLYASLMWMIYSIGVLENNYMVFILNTVVFIPFMYYRAKQEEIELKIVFKGYNDYIKKTGMFVPNILKMIRKGN